MKQRFLFVIASLFVWNIFYGSIVIDFDQIRHWTGSGPNRAALVVQNDAGASDPYAYVWGYRWEDSEAPTGEDMFKAVCENSTELILLTQRTGAYGSTVCGIGFGDARGILENIYFDFDKAKSFEFINFDYYNTSSFFGQNDAPGDATPDLCRQAIDDALSSGRHYIQHPLDYVAYGYPAYDYDCWLMKDTGGSYGWWTSAWYEGYWSYWTASASSTEWMYSGTGFSGRKLYDGCMDAWSFTMFDSPQVGGFGEGKPPVDDSAYVSYRPESTSMVYDIGEDSNNEVIELFNISGTKVATFHKEEMPAVLSGGIYIAKQGDRVWKQVIK